MSIRPCRLVYFFRRDNEFESINGDTGYDQISVIAFSLDQAKATLKELVKNPDEWHYNHVINIDKRDEE